VTGREITLKQVGIVVMMSNLLQPLVDLAFASDRTQPELLHEPHLSRVDID